jgi:hypothetical protein
MVEIRPVLWEEISRQKSLDRQTDGRTNDSYVTLYFLLLYLLCDSHIKVIQKHSKTLHFRYENLLKKRMRRRGTKIRYIYIYKTPDSLEKRRCFAVYSVNFTE